MDGWMDGWLPACQSVRRVLCFLDGREENRTQLKSEFSFLFLSSSWVYYRHCIGAYPFWFILFWFSQAQAPTYPTVRYLRGSPFVMCILHSHFHVSLTAFFYSKDHCARLFIYISLYVSYLF
ncbi:hypothetical protein B0H66DRAFT_558202, partial [Apodospora peruviana]